MRSKIIAIGTSKGIRIPKYLLDKYDLQGQVEVDDTGSGILIRPIKLPRQGWEAAFNKKNLADEDAIVDMPDSTWDKDEWEW